MAGGSKRARASAAASGGPDADDAYAVAVKKQPKPKAPLEPSIRIDDLVLKKAAGISKQLRELFPNPPIPLDHHSAFGLLVAVMLSAQSTDLKVNEVTPALFAAAPDARAMAALPVSSIESMIRVLGLAPTKARNLKAMASILVEQHGGQVPRTFEELEALPGVGHKTASVVISQAFGGLAFPVDTHIHRLAQRWGLTNGKSVEQTEADLKALFPQAEWRDLHLQIIYFGRAHCPAQRHDPSECPICGWAAVHPYDKPGWSPPRPGERDVKFKRPTPRKAKSPAGAVATTAAASDDEEEEVEEAPPRDGGAANPPAQLAADADGQQQHQGRLEDGDARRVVRRLTAQLNEAANAAGAFPSPAQEGTASSSKPAGSSVRAARKTAIQSALGVSSTTRSAGGRRPATRSTAKSQ